MTAYWGAKPKQAKLTRKGNSQVRRLQKLITSRVTRSCKVPQSNAAATLWRTGATGHEQTTHTATTDISIHGSFSTLGHISQYTGQMAIKPGLAFEHATYTYDSLQ